MLNFANNLFITILRSILFKIIYILIVNAITEYIDIEIKKLIQSPLGKYGSINSPTIIKTKEVNIVTRT